MLRPPQVRRACVGTVVATLALAAMPTVASASDPLVAQWPMEMEGGAVPDRSGRGHDGTPIATVAVPGRFAGAMAFPDTASSRVTVASAPDLEPPRLTVLAWVRRTPGGDAPGPQQVVVTKGSAPTCTPSGAAAGSYGLHTTANRGLAFSVAVGSGASRTVASTPDAGFELWSADGWHAVAGTFDGTRVRLYVDGSEVGSGTPISGEPTYDVGPSGTSTLAIGGVPDRRCGPGPQTFDGAVDEVRIYDRALSTAEIARLQTAPGAAPPELVPDVAPEPPAPPSPGPAPPRVETPVAVRGISPVGSVAARRPVVLRAVATGPVNAYRWDLDGDGRTDLTCSAEQPAVRVRAPATAATTATVTVVGRSGATASHRQTIPVAAAAALRGTAATKLVRHLVKDPVRACGDERTFTQPVTSVKEQRRSICLAPTTIRAGTALTVDGCLRPLTSLDQIPAAERGIVDRLRRRASSYAGGAAVAAGDALDLVDAYIATNAVRVNGVDIFPRNGAVVIVIPQIQAIVSSNAQPMVGDLRLDVPRDFILNTTERAGKIALGSFGTLPSALKAIGAFPLAGNVDVTLDAGGAAVTVRLKLPPWVDVAGGPGLGQVKMRATMAEGLVVDDLRIGPLNASIGGLGVNDFRIDYARASAEWRGQARACVMPGLGCLTMVPPDGGVIIRKGRLYEAGASLELQPGIVVFPSVTLQRFGFKVGLDPTRIGGNVGLTAMGIVAIDGRMMIALPSPAAPYVPTVQDVGRSLPSDVYAMRFVTPTFVAGGDVSLQVPVVGSTRVGGGYFLYSAPGKVAFGGNVDVRALNVIAISGGVDGRINFDNGRFNLLGRLRACVADVVCAGAIATLSSVGVGGCVEVGPLNVGGGVQWRGPTVKLWPFDGCKWSRFAELNVFGSSRAAGSGGQMTPVSVTIARGDRSRALDLVGADGAPRVRVTGPGGLDVSSSAGAGLVTTPRVRIMRSETLKRTVVGLVDPVPGRYTVTPLEGSPGVARVLSAEDQPDARVRATVRGKGTTRTLAYDIGRRTAQRVTFVEQGAQGPREIGRIDGGGTGRLRFKATPGPGMRTIQAQFELDGLAAETRTIARFRPPSATLARPRSVRIARRGTAIRVRWARVQGATRYELVVTSRSGQQRQLRTRARHVTIRRLARGWGGSVRVRAVDSLRQSRPRSASIATRGKPRTRFARLGRPAPRKASRKS